jgi:phosphate transport system ATP-binding protein
MVTTDPSGERVRMTTARPQSNSEAASQTGDNGMAPDDTRGMPPATPLKASVEHLDFHYGPFHALKDVSLPIAKNKITALIGPSGCGKSTLLRCFNRMHDLYVHSRYGGSIMLQPDGLNLIGPKVDPMEIRMRISMVFQKPNPFPKSIYENVAFGLRVRGTNNRGVLDEAVESSLRGAAIWDETKDRLDAPALSLSGGQQQRLCIARALATKPEMLLFDEPTSALDPLSTTRIEDLMTELRNRVTIVVVTHNMQQAARISNFTALMYLGKLVEFDQTPLLFTRPSQKMTEEYITGRFG